MINSERFYMMLKNTGVNFFTGVPDSLLNDFCLYLADNLPQDQHTIAANEGNAIAIAAGYHIATGTLPMVYMQNSGIGNSVNPLISLTNKETYAIPMILLIGWRGSPGVNDWAHHKKQGQETPVLLESLDIPYKVLDDNEVEAADLIKWAWETAMEKSGPVALLAKKGILSGGSKKNLLLEESEYPLSRENAIECIINTVPKDTIFVATTGRATREIYEVRESQGAGHEHDFLNVGAMGHASSIALGISIGSQNRLVVCLDGDAAAIMHLGSFAIAGTSGRSNLLHIVLNNGAHESVGGQPSAGHKINFTGIAESAGYHTVGCEVADKMGLEAAIKKLILSPGPGFIDMRIRKGIRMDIPSLKVSLIDSKCQMMNTLKNSAGNDS